MYKYRVSARNAVGASAWSSESTETTVSGSAPTAPAIPMVASSNGVNTITWVAPASNGSAITGYTVEYDKQTSGSFSGTWNSACTGGASDTSCEHTGLTKDDVYKYRVKATNGVGDSGWSNDSSSQTVAGAAPTAPAAPTIASASGVNTITWVAPASNGSSITGYTVEYDKQTSGSFSGSWTSACTGGASDTSCQHTGLTKDDVYKYRVKAANAVGDSSWSSDSSSQTVAASAPVAPATPTVASSNGVNTITWVAPTTTNGSAITGYTVEYDKQASGSFSGTWAQACTGGASDTSCQHTGLNSGDVYKYRVKATNGAGDSAWSSDSSNQTVSSFAPSAPGMSTVASASGVNTINWAPPSQTNGSAITSYTVQYAKKAGQSFGSWASACTGGASATSCQHTALTKDDVYKYRVRATNGSGDSAWSSESGETTVVASAPSVPTNVSASSSTAGESTITWAVPASTNGSAITGYTVQFSKKDASGDYENFADVNGCVDITTRTCTHSSLTTGDEYIYRVRAKNGAGSSDWVETSKVTVAAILLPNRERIAVIPSRALMLGDEWVMRPFFRERFRLIVG